MVTSRSIISIRRLLALVPLVCIAGCGDLGFLQPPTATPVIIIAPSVPPGSPPPSTIAPTVGQARESPTAVSDTPVGATGGLLARVQQRGTLICGVNPDLPGFGYYDNVRRQWSGFDVDFCRVVAAAIFGDATRVEFRAVSAAERWEFIREGEIDVLFRNSTWTAERDLAERVDFGPITFHDGQGFLTHLDANLTTPNDLDGHSICVTADTTSESNVRDEMAARGISVDIQPYESVDATFNAYDQRRCDAVTSDRSQLVVKQQTLTDPTAHYLMGDLISREPLAPAFIENDSQWQEVISWSIFATIYAEELRVDQQNVADIVKTTTDPRIRRLLGLDGTIGTDLGVSNDFALQIIQQVGNYADIYNRNLGPRTPFNLDRGPNKVWNLGEGGILAAPPFR